MRICASKHDADKPCVTTAPRQGARPAEGREEETTGSGARAARPRGPEGRGPLCGGRRQSGGTAFPAVTKARAGPGALKGRGGLGRLLAWNF